ncbi:hypothetical protein CLV40_11765 [Actinokineospora auranticolor]|uniref:Uncharacterized protein n=1 Tax=Actinokineospora auranticolor TaxID=155976 RepID=A0A2S6GI45_9PSEU|nr:hypothetical protein CLV40_11765 [Actinokineospora auranticolor]
MSKSTRIFLAKLCTVPAALCFVVAATAGTSSATPSDDDPKPPPTTTVTTEGNPWHG